MPGPLSNNELEGEFRPENTSPRATVSVLVCLCSTTFERVTEDGEEEEEKEEEEGEETEGEHRRSVRQRSWFGSLGSL